MILWLRMSFLYTHTILVVVIRPYTLEFKLCTLFLLQICLTDGTANATLASGIVPTVRWYYDEIHFSVCILTLTITVLQHFC